MATLTLKDLSTPELLALVRGQVMLLPIATDGGKRTLATAQTFGPFVVGDSVIVASDAGFHVLAAATEALAGAVSVSSCKMPAGVYAFTVPDGCTFVGLIDSAAGAGIGQVYKG